ncbi:MAG: hypothetical protein LBE56_06145 [Tannerella sp.]|jgi:hypothetical protein|nr:hypothetical protein [Tannerella sp.]
MAQKETETALQTKSISVFKNGQAFVMKEGEVPAENGIYTLEKAPEALFGTLWFLGLQTDIVQVTSKQEEVSESTEGKVSGFRDLLYANRDKQVTVTTDDGKTYTGMVEDMEVRVDPAPVLLKTSGQWVSILPSSIKKIEFAAKPALKLVSDNKTMKPVIKVQFAKAGKQPLRMMYLQNNIAWTPTYLLELQSETEARLKMQAEVANNAEDITNTSMNFVVGVPNFKNAVSPATLVSFIQALPQNDYDVYPSSRYSNVMMSQAMDNAYPMMEGSPYDTDLEVQSDVSEDLYFYNVENVSLAKGGRAHYPLLDIPVKIRHLYECILPTQNENIYSNYSAGSSGYSFNVQYANVAHSIEITNDSKNPLTTASVMMIDGKTQRPLSQDIIKYTAIGQKSSVELTKAPDVRVQEQEKITGSKTETIRRRGYDNEYMLLTVESEVVIVNSKTRDIDMVIYKTISGKSKSATVNYTGAAAPTGNINPMDKLKFTLTVKAGQTAKFTYAYEKYVEM